MLVRKSKRLKEKLPKRLIIIENADKKFTEKWYPGRDELDIPAPFRMIAVGPPGVGKGIVLINIIARCTPVFEEIYLIHCSLDTTREYDNIDFIPLYEIPPPEFWSNGDTKKLVILDDIDYKSLSKTQLKNLSRLVGYNSTHCNVNVCICQQDAFELPPIVRRCANLYVLWKTPDMDSLATCARKTGFKSGDLRDLFGSCMSDPHDSLWIDLTRGSPYPLRKNGYTHLKKADDIDRAFEQIL